MKKVLLIILLLLVVLGIAAGVGVWKVRHLADSKLLIKEETIFTLKPGTGRLALGEQLYADKIINRPRVFQWLLRIEPDLSHFKAGTYRFTPQMTVREMLKLLESGKEAQFPLRLVEGMRLSDYLKQLREAPYIKHTLSDDKYATVAQALELENPEWIEGWFWPDTWMYTANTTDVALLKRAHKKMVKAVDSAWEGRADGLPYKMRREMSHQISATTCSDVVLNQLSIAGLNLYDYVPQDYEIRKYGEQKKNTQPAATDLIGQKAPDWMLKDMYEKPVALSEFKSKVLLVNLTGIGCGACHASIPFLNGLKGKFNAGEFEVVSIETWGREPHSLRTYADKNQINYSFLCGDEGIVKSYRTYGAAPLFFILDQDRVIRKVIRGYRMGRTDEEITDAIKALL